MRTLHSDNEINLTLQTIQNCAIYKITMHNDENRFTDNMNTSLLTSLKMIKTIYSQQSPPTHKCALIITGKSKVFSQGLDLLSYSEKSHPQRHFENTLLHVLELILTMPMITCAQINGHAMAAGMVLAFACDYRLMRTERGFMSMTELLLPSSIPAGLVAVLVSKIANPSVRRDIMLGAQRFTGKQIFDLGLIDQMHSEADLDRECQDFVAKKSWSVKKGPFVHLVKECLYKKCLKELRRREKIDHFEFAAEQNK